MREVLASAVRDRVVSCRPSRQSEPVHDAASLASILPSRYRQQSGGRAAGAVAREDQRASLSVLGKSSNGSAVNGCRNFSGVDAAVGAEEQTLHGLRTRVIVRFLKRPAFIEEARNESVQDTRRV